MPSRAAKSGEVPRGLEPWPFASFMSLPLSLEAVDLPLATVEAALLGGVIARTAVFVGERLDRFRRAVAAAGDATVNGGRCCLRVASGQLTCGLCVGGEMLCVLIAFGAVIPL